MKLHERDYTQLTDGEHAEWRSLQEQEVVDKLVALATSHSDGHPQDDITLLAFRYLGPPKV